jgi:DNA-binding response OmpR family regulator
VLLVGHDIVAAQKMAHALHDRGFEVLLATDCLGAIKRLTWEHVDALVVDLDPPDADAWPVAEFARSQAPSIPLIFVASSRELDAGEAHLDPPPLAVERRAVPAILSGALCP